MIYIGTSGYSYPDWIGPFYNQGIEKRQMLEEYSKVFKFTEINSTYYSIPNKYMFFSLVKKTPADFKFSIKLHGSMTHTRDAGNEAYKSFNEAIMPLVEAGRLGCLVAQFPYSFHRNEENFEYIKELKEKFDSVPICIEFRNSGWLNMDTYKILQSEKLGFVCVDEPDVKGLLKPSSIVTSSTGYIRLHGRNAQKWYNHNESYERYDYQYSQDELIQWIPRIKFIDDRAENTFIAFNNHFRAQGAVNASMIQRLLNDRL